MKKLVAFIIFAAAVGTALSWLHRPGAEDSVDGDQKKPVQAAPAKPDDVGAEREEPGMSADSRGAEKKDAQETSEPESDAASAPPAAEGKKVTQKKDTDKKGTGSEPDQERSEPAPSSPQKPENDDEGPVRKGKELMDSGQMVKARRILTRTYREREGAARTRTRKLLDRINSDLIFNPDIKKGATIHTVKSGETLTEIADSYDVNWRMVALVNGIENPGGLQVGQELKILTGEPHVVVDKSEFTLTLYMGDYYVKEYDIGIGEQDKTPTGTFTVETMLKKPTWYRPDGGVVEYGEEGHLLGVRWMGFKDKPHAQGYGIHGTNDPSSIGTKCSNGCIRLRNEDVKELFTFVVKGTEVRIKE